MKGDSLLKVWFWAGVVLYSTYKLVNSAVISGVLCGKDEAYNEILNILNDIKKEEEK